MNYHQPVMLEEATEGLQLMAGKTYVDATFGGGGHTKEILKKLEGGKVFAFDQDLEAAEKAKSIMDERLVFLKQNFRFLKNNLKYHNAIPVSGILADLGVSSHQFDTAERGFSYRFENSLDMRMNQKSLLTAREVLNKYTEENLKKLFRDYGEIENAGRLASEIAKARRAGEIKTVNEFLEVIRECVFKKNEMQYLSRVFQALRIEVNDELSALKEFLNQSLSVLGKGGRLVVIAYHSLEDRLVKNIFRTGNFEGIAEKDFYGNVKRAWQPVNSKVIVPGENEILSNPRARSAKMRIAEKI